MNKYYVRDENSPFFKYMQNTEKENLLSEQEKYETYHAAIANIVFNMFEGGEVNEHEKNFAIYVAFNNIDANKALTIIIKESLGLDIDFDELDRKNNGYILPEDNKKAYDEKNN